MERIVRGRPVRVADAPPVALLAASADRLAVVAADLAPSDLSERPRPVDVVQILDAVSGAVIAEYDANVPITALAFSGPRGAVLLSDTAGTRIEWFDTASGQQLGQVEVAPETEGIDLAGSRLVYRVGKAIRLLDLQNGQQETLTKRKFAPLGLSIEHRRVAWAENGPGRRGSIRHITLDASSGPAVS